MGIGPHAKDLRTFLAEVKQRYPEELITVEREADLRFEISALLVKLDRAHKFPITQFTNLRDVDGQALRLPFADEPFCQPAAVRARARLFCGESRVGLRHPQSTIEDTADRRSLRSAGEAGGAEK